MHAQTRKARKDKTSYERHNSDCALLKYRMFRFRRVETVDAALQLI